MKLCFHLIFLTCLATNLILCGHKKTGKDKYKKRDFALDRHNILDIPIDKLIQELKKNVENEYSEHQERIDMKTYNPEKFRKLEEHAQRTGHSLYFQMHDYIRAANYIRPCLKCK